VSEPRPLATSAPSAPRVTVLWCDFGGVLTPPIAEAIAAIVDASEVSWPELRLAADAVAGELGLRGLEPLELGRLTQAEWGARVTARLPAGWTPAIELGDWGDYWYRDRAANAELLHELKRIAGTGVQVGLLTNSVLEWEPHRARMLAGFMPFTAEVRSHELGLAKPDPRIYVYADTVLPPNGGRVVFIDDLEANCEAAERHGWVAQHHTDTQTTLTRLRQLHDPLRQAQGTRG